MSARTYTAWTCDRCGLREEVERGKQPSHWMRLGLFDPPLSIEGRSPRTDLCLHCVRSFKAWLGRGEAS